MAFSELSSPVVHCTVTSRPDAGVRKMVKNALPPSAMLTSPMLSTGRGSSSMMDRLALFTVRSGALPWIVIVSVSSFRESSFGHQMKVCCPLFCPAGMVRLKLSTGA